MEDIEGTPPASMRLRGVVHAKDADLLRAKKHRCDDAHEDEQRDAARNLRQSDAAA